MLPYQGNFNVFYYLFAAPAALKSQLKLAHDASHYRYLHSSHPSLTDNHTRLAERFEQFSYALGVVGIGKKKVAQLTQIWAAILHLGNIE